MHRHVRRPIPVNAGRGSRDRETERHSQDWQPTVRNLRVVSAPIWAPARPGQRRRTRTLSSRLSLPAAVVALTLIAVACFYLSRLLFLGLLYGIPLVTIAFLAIAIPRFWRITNRAQSKQTRWAFQLHTVRSVLVALAAMALILMMLGSFEAPFILVFAAAVPYLFFGVPAVGALIANLLRGQPDAELF